MSGRDNDDRGGIFLVITSLEVGSQLGDMNISGIGSVDSVMAGQGRDSKFAFVTISRLKYDKSSE